MSYTHLSREERYQIQCLREGGWKLRELAKWMGRSASTLSRELRRNQQPERGYAYRDAEVRSVTRRHRTSAHPRIDAATWAHVEAKLAEDWSPEQIAGEGTVAVSHERIYQHIAVDQVQGGTLWRHLRRQRRRYRRRCGEPRGHQRFGGRRLHERPAGVTTRWRVGDWEGDTIVGPTPARIVTLVDRKSGYTRLQRVPDGKALTVAAAVLRTLYPLRRRVHTITWDNGSEFAEHALIDVALETTSSFADPYSAWQRGCDENLNGLIRQYAPKGSDLSTLSTADLQRIEDKLNRRPRKRLGFRTPLQVFEASFNRVALRS
ncbi:MAG TPA: IS30 family transposase [Nevskiaceae bacterium]|nr:IS30 family transposase [Nevskiaceae bacterium]